ncbi:hypothetical protein [Frateuria defendens]|uniref:hypothetical protein n=1 Tax=Frateuria defendens TaxID=2219559 RepID=UPI00069F5D77|nr:hypothetical protein [Frateuria defendens]
MRGWRRFALVVGSLLPLLAIAAPAKPAGPASQDKAAQADNQALLAFQRDLVSVVAPRADALPLLGAALLARPLVDQPKYNTFHSLIERAAAAPGHGPAVSWLRLADCDAQAGACPNPGALAALVQEAPDNAAVWLLKLGQDAHDLKPKDARADLARAAAAKLYDDYTGSSLQALASTATTLPPPKEAVAAAGSATGVQVMLVFGLAGTQPQPGLPAVARLCEGARDDQALKDDCLKLGKTLEWGSSPLARSLGLHLRETLAAEPAEQEEARRTRRELVWQVQSFAQLSARAPTDPALAQHLLALARRGGTEMSLLLAALRDNSLPVSPPSDWQPHATE